MARKKGSRDKQKRKLNLHSKIRVGSLVAAGGLGGTTLGLYKLQRKTNELQQQLNHSTIKDAQKIVEKYGGEHKVPAEVSNRFIESTIKKRKLAEETILKSAPKTLLLGGGLGLAAGAVGGSLLYRRLKNKENNEN